MAYYERKLLLPYLQDVSSIELLCQKLIREYNQAVDYQRKTSNQLTTAQNMRPPQKISKSKYKNAVIDNLLIVVLFILPFALWIIGGQVEKAFYMLIIRALAGVVAFVDICIFPTIFREMKAEKKRYKSDVKNEEDYAKFYSDQQAKLSQFTDANNNAKNRVTTAKRRLDEAVQLRQQVYSVNIIPSRYRNVHVACYLYDYFETSRETDLDKILQTMLLDEINQKIDKVLYKLEEVLLNQRWQIALQHAQNSAMQRNHREEMTALAKLERNQEMQHEYLQMIETNTAVSAFFSVADYFQTRDYIQKR